MIFAVVPAAGLSSRMGRPKLSLPLGSSSVLEHVVSALRSGGCNEVVVVVGPHVPELAPLAESAEQEFDPRPDDAWLLAPADHPTLDETVVRRLIAEYARGKVSVLVPTFAGQRGHPSLIAWRHLAALRCHSPGGGLNSFLRTLSQETGQLPVCEESILSDLDTPEDYERLRARFGS
jgi:molybdenum cofactor cytidylyltransferase